MKKNESQVKALARSLYIFNLYFKKIGKKGIRNAIKLTKSVCCAIHTTSLKSVVSDDDDDDDVAGRK